MSEESSQRTHQSESSFKRFASGATEALSSMANLGAALIAATLAVLVVAGFCIFLPAELFNAVWPQPADPSISENGVRFVAGGITFLGWNAFLTYPIVNGLIRVMEGSDDE